MVCVLYRFFVFASEKVIFQLNCLFLGNVLYNLNKKNTQWFCSLAALLFISRNCTIFKSFCTGSFLLWRTTNWSSTSTKLFRIKCLGTNSKRKILESYQRLNNNSKTNQYCVLLPTTDYNIDTGGVWRWNSVFGLAGWPARISWLQALVIRAQKIFHRGMHLVISEAGKIRINST